MAKDERVIAFLKVLDAGDSTTGGGTASAIVGAMAGGLAAMVARLSLNKPDLEPEQFYVEREKALVGLSQELFSGGAQDAAAFHAVRDAYRLPKNSEQEKERRRNAVQAAWIRATEIPLTNAEKCAQVLSLALDLDGRSNENAASDLRCAQYLSYVGVLGCLENVEINLPQIKDDALVETVTTRANAIRAKLAGHGPDLIGLA